LRPDANRLDLKITGGLTPPRGGLVFEWPYANTPGRALVNGRPARWENGRTLRIHALPAAIAIDNAPDDAG
jgi:hypothetical protein